MRSDVKTTGTLRLDDEGHIVACDARLRVILNRDEAELLGLHVLSVTAHADRDRCIAIFNQIRKDGLPLTTTRRIIRADRSHAWVHIEVRVPDWPRSRAVELRVEECAAPVDWIEPGRLLLLARSMFQSRRARASAFGSEMFSNHAWDMLLAAYVAEAEGGTMTIVELQRSIDLSPTIAARWLRVLIARHLVEYECADPEPPSDTPIRLTGAAHRKFERFLSDLYRDNVQLQTQRTPFP